jgi:osmotically-inducible protein OsmY
MGKGLSFLAGTAVGAAAVFFLDPQGGGRRRGLTPEKAVSTVRSTATGAAASAKHAADRAQGAVAAAMPSVGRTDSPDDVTLTRKVESEIFRSDDAPKGQVSVNAENGVVFLRGEVDDQAWIDRLGDEAGRVDGVKAVRNLLHRPGTDAPAAPATT